MLTADNFSKEKHVCWHHRHGLCREDERELLKCSYKICPMIPEDEPDPDYIRDRLRDDKLTGDL